jgi:hypothetical protein
MMIGMNQNMFVSFPKALRSFQRCRPLCSDRATMRLRLRDNNRGHYTNAHVVLHANSTPDGCATRTLGFSDCIDPPKSDADGGGATERVVCSVMLRGSGMLSFSVR